MGTVRIAEGGFVQPVNEPTGDWGAENSPARYADTMEFGIQLNRRFYREMKDFLKALGAKAPSLPAICWAGQRTFMDTQMGT